MLSPSSVFVAPELELTNLLQTEDRAPVWPGYAGRLCNVEIVQKIK